MKKLSLKALNLSGAEVLTREQLKNVLGGGPFVVQTTSGGGGDTCFICDIAGGDREWDYGDCNSTTAKTDCLKNTCTTYSC